MPSRVDGGHPDLWGLHHSQTETALRVFFRTQADVVLGDVLQGLLLFDEGTWITRLAEVIFDRGKAAAEDYALRVFMMFGRSVRFSPEQLDPWVSEVAVNASRSITGTVLQTVTDAFTGSDEPADAVSDVYDRLQQGRARVYATSFTTTFGNFGAHDGAVAGGAGSKTWRTTSGKPRRDHAALNGTSVAIGERFPNGMRWPGDPSGGADQVANCACVMEFT